MLSVVSRRRSVVSLQIMTAATSLLLAWSRRSVSAWQPVRTTTTTTHGRGAMLPTPWSRLCATTTTSDDQQQLCSIDTVQTRITNVLNDLFDPKEIARGRAQIQYKKLRKKDADTWTDATVTEAVDSAVAQAPSRFDVTDAMVTRATKAEFGDYQCNAALTLAPALGLPPRTVAEQIIEGLTSDSGGGESNNVFDTPTVAGPGFVNLRFTNDYLTRAVATMAADPDRLGVTPAAQPQKIVVDFSSPNIAKEMHVGHLRSTIIGDTLCNVLSFCGHDVKRLNHVGDWGTQFGMLVEHLRDEYPEALSLETSQNVQLGDLVLLYKAAKKRFDDDDDFKVRARNGVVKLQAGNAPELAAWEALCAASRVEYNKIYDLLNIEGLEERGESFYNPFLNDVIEDLVEKDLAVESDGALAVFLDGYTNRDGSPLPMLVRKSDGGFNYATTDLAAIRHRTLLPDGEKADRVLYVTDAGQSQHFKMVFEAAKLAKFLPDNTKSLEHVPFGLVQGEDGKKFATRSGETVKLKDLLEEAVRIAGKDLKERSRDGDKEFVDRVDRVARIVGIGAVKYADLSMNRESNYRFSYERMLSLNGNTAPYMLYAYARICGIVRKVSGQADTEAVQWPAAADEILITHESEADLMRTLVKLPDVIQEVERELYTNRICDYLFATSQSFNQFYENCSVNNAETPELKASRLSLCTATAGTLRLLLTLLGMELVEKL